MDEAVSQSCSLQLPAAESLLKLESDENFLLVSRLIERTGTVSSLITHLRASALHIKVTYLMNNMVFHSPDKHEHYGWTEG